MSFSMCVLGSGSGGNCTLLQFQEKSRTRFALIDCGLSMRETKRRLAPMGIELSDIDDILLTHLDFDHFSPPWANNLEKFDITLHIHHRHRARALQNGVQGRRLELFNGEFQLGESTAVETVHFAHDNLGTVGFLIEHDEMRLGFATDLGHVPDSIFDHFRGLHALAFESNYDRQMQVNSPRPAFLKRRIMGGSGHLSNVQSFDTVQRIAADSNLSHIVLLHLSRDCNNPKLINRQYAECAPDLLDRLTITSQCEPTPMLNVHRLGAKGLPIEPRSGKQLAMFD
ncbi:MAG: MBL fold metallo-hydrolase [Planctomycetota bacterium]|nr:MBL fold metallo-hydrolase [Planctomycetota bacterium]